MEFEAMEEDGLIMIPHGGGGLNQPSTPLAKRCPVLQAKPDSCAFVQVVTKS